MYSANNQWAANGYFGKGTSDFIVQMLTDCYRKPDQFTPFAEEMRDLEGDAKLDRRTDRHAG